jgi:hypothetical protein
MRQASPWANQPLQLWPAYQPIDTSAGRADILADAPSCDYRLVGKRLNDRVPPRTEAIFIDPRMSPYNCILP